jgi:hypothetical protein
MDAFPAVAPDIATLEESALRPACTTWTTPDDQCDFDVTIDCVDISESSGALTNAHNVYKGSMAWGLWVTGIFG